MKIVHAIWERRNLGMDAWEITVEQEDFKSFDDVIRRLKDFLVAGTYIVVKMPVGNYASMCALEALGFKFVETQMQIICDFDRFRMPPLFARMEDYLTCEELEHADERWDLIISRISEDMFVSDRIFLDPAFPPGTSAIRYKNWLRDMRGDETKHMMIRHSAKDGTITSFDVLTYRGANAIAILGGVFPDQQMLGIPHLLSLFKYLRQRGCSKFITHISSNNLSVMRVYAQMGGVVSDAQYVYQRVVPR